jgi:uncharacterized protein YgiB involved in biofilm formation
MARLTCDAFRFINKARYNVQNTIVGSYATFRDNNGRQYFQIDTYGNPDREATGQVSQSIQFDETFARELVRILQDVYNIN